MNIEKLREEILDELVSLYKDYSSEFGYENFLSEKFKNIIKSFNVNKNIIHDLDDIADEFSNDPDEDISIYAEYIWDIIAPLRQIIEQPAKKEARKLKESADLANLIAEVKDIRDDLSTQEDQSYLDLADDLTGWIKDVDYNGLTREEASELYNICECYEDTDAVDVIDELLVITKRIIEALYSFDEIC